MCHSCSVFFERYSSSALLPLQFSLPLAYINFVSYYFVSCILFIFHLFSSYFFWVTQCYMVNRSKISQHPFSLVPSYATILYCTGWRIYTRDALAPTGYDGVEKFLSYPRWWKKPGGQKTQGKEESGRGQTVTRHRRDKMERKWKEMKNKYNTTHNEIT